MKKTLVNISVSFAFFAVTFFDLLMINQLKRTQVPLTFVGNSTQVRIAQVVTALLAEQCCDNMVIMAEQTMFTLVATMLFSIDEATIVVHGCWNRR